MENIKQLKEDSYAVLLGFNEIFLFTFSCLSLLLVFFIV